MLLNLEWGPTAPMVFPPMHIHNLKILLCGFPIDITCHGKNNKEDVFLHQNLDCWRELIDKLNAGTNDIFEYLCRNCFSTAYEKCVDNEDRIIAREVFK